jgi:manganese transport protein
LITSAAELGGMAIILRLLTSLPEKVLLLIAALVLGLIVGLLRFQWIERLFGLAGVTMAVSVVAALLLRTDWTELAHGLLPHLSLGNTRQSLRYWYFAVGIFSAMLMEYEVHFYSSGSLEEDWTLRICQRILWSLASVRC